MKQIKLRQIVILTLKIYLGGSYVKHTNVEENNEQNANKINNVGTKVFFS